MKLYIADYLADTTHLTRGEHGAYLLLLMALWRAGGKLPRDPGKLARIAKCTADEWADIGPVVMEFFKIGGGSITQKRASKEIAKYHGVVKGSKTAGKASAAKRANKNNAQDATDVDETFIENPTNQNHNQKEETPTPLEGEAKGRRKPRKALPADFPTLDLIEEQQAKARTAGADLDVSAEAERFRNHALSTDRRCSDWSAAWRNWVLKAIGWAPKVPGFALPVPADDDPWRSRLLNWNVNQYWNSEWGPKPGKPGYLGPEAMGRAA